MIFFNLVKQTIGSTGSIFPLKTLIALTKQNIILPFYHSVSDKTPAHIRNVYTSRTIQQFTNDLDFLCKHFKPVSIEQLHNNINNKILDEKIFHLTFDDGLSEFYHVAAPILEKKGVPATIFLNSDFIDNKELFYRYKVSLIIDEVKKSKALKDTAQILSLPNTASKSSVIKKIYTLNINHINTINKLVNTLNINIKEYIKQEQPYMSTTQIKDLLNRGFSIGSHSVNHPHFIHINSDEQKEQVVNSFKFLEENFGITQRYFAFPFSDEGITKSFLTWLIKEQQCKLSFGISDFNKDVLPFHLHRIAMEEKNCSTPFLLKRKYMLYFIKTLARKNSISRD